MADMAVTDGDGTRQMWEGGRTSKGRTPATAEDESRSGMDGVRHRDSGKDGTDAGNCADEGAREDEDRGSQVSGRRTSSRRAAVAAVKGIQDGRRGTRAKDGSGTMCYSREEQVLLKVRANRQKRSLTNQGSTQGSEKHRKRATTTEYTDERPVCFVCNKVLPKRIESMHAHIDACLAKIDGTDGTVSPYGSTGAGHAVDWNEEGVVEEYTWAGQTRVRVTSMIEGGFQASGFHVHKKTDVDVEEDVLIDDNEEDVFGAGQYSQDDIRKYVAEPAVQANGETLESPVLYPGGEDEEIDIETIDISKELAKFLTEVPSDAKLIIEALTQKLKSLEKGTPKAKCLICCEDYTKPVVSINCWHVHCEKCWLTTLGMKRLCPQCQHITAPGDLRQIFL